MENQSVIGLIRTPGKPPNWLWPQDLLDMISRVLFFDDKYGIVSGANATPSLQWQNSWFAAGKRLPFSVMSQMGPSVRATRWMQSGSNFFILSYLARYNYYYSTLLE
jgi:hypothetical protein